MRSKVSEMVPVERRMEGSVGHRLKSRLANWRNYIVYIAFVIVLLVFSITIGRQGFLQPTNLLNIVRETTMISIEAVAMTFVIATGEIDLSIGSTAALAALMAGLAMQSGMGFIGGVAAGLLSGIVVGIINGLLTTVAGIPSFLVTLGMMELVGGVDMWVTNTNPIAIVSQLFNNVFGSGNLGPIPVLFIWTILALVVGHVVFRKTSFGRKVLATGGNRTAAEYSGINTRRIKFLALIITGAAAALAGMLYAGMMQTARYDFGTGDELSAIAAVILGGTSLFGGNGSIVGTIIGSLLIGTINNGLIIMGLNVAQQMVVSGAIIILAVAFGRKTNR